MIERRLPTVRDIIGIAPGGFDTGREEPPEVAFVREMAELSKSKYADDSFCEEHCKYWDGDECGLLWRCEDVVIARECWQEAKHGN